MKLSDSMKRMLLDLLLHGNIHHSLRGQAEHGGASGTRYALVRRGLLAKSMAPELTEAGRAEAEKVKAEWGQ